MKDRFGREINYLRISVTEKCNFNCQYCRPIESKEIIEDGLTNEELLKVVKASASIGINKIRLTGGEPLLRVGIVELISQMKSVEGINEIVMTSNGSLLGHQLVHLKKAGLNRVNISLDTLDPIKYKFITKGGQLEKVLESIDLLLELGMKPVKINVVLIKGFNDDEINDFVNLTKDKEVIIRFIELMPLGDNYEYYETHYMNNHEIIQLIPELIPIKSSPHEVAKYYQLPNALGKIGLISSISENFCGDCNRIRLTSDGKLKTCLHADTELDLIQAIRNQVDLEEFLKQAIYKKPKSHHINQKNYQPVKRNMVRIGG